MAEKSEDNVKSYDDEFSECYKRLSPILKKFVSRQIQDWDTAEEIVQEIFTYLYQKNEPMDKNPKELVGFLFRAARNRVSDYRRKQQRHPVFCGGVDQTPDISSISKIENRVVTRETYNEVTKMISDEPQPFREIFLRSYRDGQAIRQISRDMNISEYTISRVLKKFSMVVKEKVGPLYQ
jgi:RNA polymerase sigma factor (sigma-70 family)